MLAAGTGHMFGCQQHELGGVEYVGWVKLCVKNIGKQVARILKQN